MTRYPNPYLSPDDPRDEFTDGWPQLLQMTALVAGAAIGLVAPAWWKLLGLAVIVATLVWVWATGRHDRK